MCVPHGPEAATADSMITDPEIHKVYHAACKDEYRHEMYQVTADVLKIFFSN